MNDLDRQLELSVGGPLGIHITAGRPPSPKHVTAAPGGFGAALPSIGHSRRWLAAYGRIVALGLALLGGLAAGLGVSLVHALSLPWLFYLSALVPAGALWTGALAAFVAHRTSRRHLAAAAEREILHIAAHSREPLTVADVARSLGLSLAEAEAALTDMARAGHLVADVDLDGGHLYFSVPTATHRSLQDLRS